MSKYKHYQRGRCSSKISSILAQRAGLDSGYLPQTWVIKPKSLPTATVYLLVVVVHTHSVGWEGERQLAR